MENLVCQPHKTNLLIKKSWCDYMSERNEDRLCCLCNRVSFYYVKGKLFCDKHKEEAIKYGKHLEFRKSQQYIEIKKENKYSAKNSIKNMRVTKSSRSL